MFLPGIPNALESYTESTGDKPRRYTGIDPIEQRRKLLVSTESTIYEVADGIRAARSRSEFKYSILMVHGPGELSWNEWFFVKDYYHALWYRATIHTDNRETRLEIYWNNPKVAYNPCHGCESRCTRCGNNYCRYSCEGRSVRGPNMCNRCDPHPCFGD